MRIKREKTEVPIAKTQGYSIASLGSPLDGTVETFSFLPLLSPIQQLTLDAAMTFFSAAQ